MLERDGPRAGAVARSSRRTPSATPASRSLETVVAAASRRGMRRARRWRPTAAARASGCGAGRRAAPWSSRAPSPSSASRGGAGPGRAAAPARRALLVQRLLRVARDHAADDDERGSPARRRSRRAACGRCPAAPRSTGRASASASRPAPAAGSGPNAPLPPPLLRRRGRARRAARRERRQQDAMTSGCTADHAARPRQVLRRRAGQRPAVRREAQPARRERAPRSARPGPTTRPTIPQPRSSASSATGM